MSDLSNVYLSMIKDIDNAPLVLALLHSLQENSMQKLAQACIELDPEQREGVVALLKNLGSGVPVADFVREQQQSDLQEAFAG